MFSFALDLYRCTIVISKWQTVLKKLSKYYAFAQYIKSAGTKYSTQIIIRVIIF